MLANVMSISNITELQNSISPPQRWKEKVTGKRNTVKELIFTKVNYIVGLNIKNMIGYGRTGVGGVKFCKHREVG